MKMKNKGQLLLTVLLGLFILVGINVLVKKIDWQMDLTKNKRYSLSKSSQDLLKSIKEKVDVLCFYRPGERGKKQLEDLLRLYAKENKLFNYEFIDPDRAPGLAKEYEIHQSGEVVVKFKNKKEKLFLPNEEKLSNALMRLSSEEKGKIYIVSGHGEASLFAGGDRSLSKLKKILNEQGLKVEEISLVKAGKVPEDALTLLIVGAKKDFLESELSILKEYLDQGGRLLVALMAEEKNNLWGWLASELGVQLKQGFVLDPVGKLVLGSFMAAVGQDYPYHPITEDFNFMTVFPTALALEIKAGKGKASPLIKSSEGAWLETDLKRLKKGEAQFDEGQDVRGPLNLAVWVEEKDKKEREKETRILVFGDDDWLTDKYVELGGNKELLSKGLSWLRSREKLLSLSKPKVANSFLFLSQGEKLTITVVPLLVLPLLCLLLAGLVALRRRS